jgi:hypothetical protein
MIDLKQPHVCTSVECCEPEAFVDCPACGGAWHLDVDEQGLPYTCFVCCNTGTVTATVAASYADEEARGTGPDRYPSIIYRNGKPVDVS